MSTKQISLNQMHASLHQKEKKINFHRLEIDHDEGASAILNNRSSNPRPFQQYLATKTLLFLLLENISKEEKKKSKSDQFPRSVNSQRLSQPRFAGKH